VAGGQESVGFGGAGVSRVAIIPRFGQATACTLAVVGCGWLALSALLYLAGLGLSGVFWFAITRRLSAHPTWIMGLRAYFVSQLGKYAPGKALALVIRVGMVLLADRTPAATAALAAFYEVLTTMAAGALLALALAPLVVSGGCGRSCFRVDYGILTPGTIEPVARRL
jgi:hypothetical protein